MDSDDDDVPTLSGDALAALQSFYTQRDQEADAFEQLKSVTGQGTEQNEITISMFKEDWNASQFWFTDETASYLARQLLQGCTSQSAIAVVSAPSVYVQLRNLLATNEYPTPAKICLLEYDDRFELLEGFVKFDFNKPTDLPRELEASFNVVLVDPPFHSAECIVKYGETTNWLMKKDASEEEEAKSKRRLICTGEIMEDIVVKSFPGVGMTEFKPLHTMRLDNKYACFSNFTLSSESPYSRES